MDSERDFDIQMLSYNIRAKNNSRPNNEINVSVDKHGVRRKHRNWANYIIDADAGKSANCQTGRLAGTDLEGRLKNTHGIIYGQTGTSIIYKSAT